MTEPCRHERVPSDEIRSFVGSVQALVKVERERDEALATIVRVRAIVDSPDAALVVDRLRAALEAKP